MMNFIEELRNNGSVIASANVKIGTPEDKIVKIGNRTAGHLIKNVADFDLKFSITSDKPVFTLNQKFLELIPELALEGTGLTAVALNGEVFFYVCDTTGTNEFGFTPDFCHNVKSKEKGKTLSWRSSVFAAMLEQNNLITAITTEQTFTVTSKEGYSGFYSILVESSDVIQKEDIIVEKEVPVIQTVVVPETISSTIIVPAEVEQVVSLDLEPKPIAVIPVEELSLNQKLMNDFDLAGPNNKPAVSSEGEVDLDSLLA